MLGLNSSGYSWNGLRISSRYMDLRMRLWLLPTLTVSGVIEHIELDKGLDMVDKAGTGEIKWISQKWLSNETNKLTSVPKDP